MSSERGEKIEAELTQKDSKQIWKNAILEKKQVKNPTHLQVLIL